MKNKKWCPNCEEKSVGLDKLEITFGKEVFSGKGYVCSNCNNYLRDRRLLNQINEWAEQFSEKKFIIFQPLLSDSIRDDLEQFAKSNNVGISVLARILTIIYVDSLVNKDYFGKIKKFADQSESFNTYIKQGKRKKLDVNFKFSTFKKIDLYSRVWNINNAQVIEEAVQHCLMVLCHSELLIQEIEETKQMQTEIQNKVTLMAEAA